MNKYKFLKDEHIHTLDGQALTGTTSVLDILGKTLTYWAAGLAVGKLGWLNSKLYSEDERLKTAGEFLASLDGITTEDYLKILDGAYKAHAKTLKEKAKTGTDLHEVCEKFCKGQELTAEEKKLIKFFVDWAGKNVKRFLVSEGHCYSEKYWLGGIIDCLVELKSGEVGLLDFKSAKSVYFSQFCQLGGYYIQITENGVFDAEGNKVYELEKPITFLGVLPFGAKEPKMELRYDVENFKKSFINALEIYRAKGKTNLK